MIAEYFYQHQHSELTRGQLKKELNVEESEQVIFQKAIKELEKEGLLHAPKKGKIHGIKSEQWMIGKLNVNPKGYGFVVNREEKKAIFIPKEQMNEAIHKDVVIVKITHNEKDMRNPEGKIVSILMNDIKTLVGTYQQFDDFGFVVPDDPRYQQDVYIPEGCSLNAQSNDKVVTLITEHPKRNRKPVGKIIEVIGLKGDKDVELLSILKEKNIPYEFPTEVVDQANKIEKSIKASERNRRTDFTDKIVFTIDGEDAKDLDDAISIEKTKDGHYLLGVHIADVAHYVRESSPIDKEALRRGTSVYLIDTVIPMLPKELSNKLCSLQPFESKLTLSVMMNIHPNGQVTEIHFYESVIQSKARLTYNEVTEYVNGLNPEFSNRYPFLEKPIQWLHELTLILQQKRQKRGSIEFDFDEAKIILNEEGKVVDIMPYERGIANEMIEESMLVCNESVAEYFSHKEIPFVYRIHNEPREEKMKEFQSFIESNGYSFELHEEIHPKELQKFMDSVKGTKEEKAINLLLLHSMMQARYSPECIGHFGLSTPFYTHFTSPIRRYTDLQIHRIIKEFLQNQLNEKRETQLKEIVQESSKIASRKERIAEQAEEGYKNLKKAEWMQDKIGEIYEGIITDVNRSSLTICLDNTIEGKVLLHCLKGENYQYVEFLHQWINEETDTSYRIGDRIRVKVREVQLQQREIVFDIVANLTQ